VKVIWKDGWPLFLWKFKYGSFWIINFKKPKTRVHNIQTMNLPIEEIAKQFGVGLKA
jgi:hypothetical protein